MRVYEANTLAANTLELNGSVATIGAFDGFHRGHQSLIREVTDLAAKLQVPSVVYTFDPPPRNHFQGARVLTPLAEKLRRLEELGVDRTIVATFHDRRAGRSAASFVRELAALNPQEVLVGECFRFGRGREGHAGILAQHFPTRAVEPLLCLSGEPISSTRVRELLSDGHAGAASELLGWNVGKTEPYAALAGS